MRDMLRATAAALILAAPAAAQNGPIYIGGVVGAHAERGDFVDGHTAALGFVGGVRVSRSWGIEVEVGRPAADVLSETISDGIRYSREREVVSTLSVGAVYQPRVHPRWQPRLFVGVFNNRTRDRFTTGLQADGVPSTLPGFRPTNERYTRNLGGASVGGGVSFAINRHLSVGPDVRYDYGSMGDEINNALRTSARVVWSF